jgi:hypothetical protein
MVVRLSGWSNRGEWDGPSMWHVWGAREVNTGVLGGKLRERDLFKNLGVYGPLILTWVLRKWVGTAWIGFIWLRKENMVGSCDSDLGTSCSVKWEEFLVSCGNIGFSKWSLLNRFSYIGNNVYSKLLLWITFVILLEHESCFNIQSFIQS